jgi:hypothetical protein
MKKLIFIALVAFGVSAQAQNIVKTDSKGNYYQDSTAKSVKIPAKSTGKTFTDSKGLVYPVFENEKGRIFYIRKSKTSGKSYNVYLTVKP